MEEYKLAISCHTKTENRTLWIVDTESEAVIVPVVVRLREEGWEGAVTEGDRVWRKHDIMAEKNGYNFVFL